MIEEACNLTCWFKQSSFRDHIPVRRNYQRENLSLVRELECVQYWPWISISKLPKKHYISSVKYPCWLSRRFFLPVMRYFCQTRYDSTARYEWNLGNLKTHLEIKSRHRNKSGRVSSRDSEFPNEYGWSYIALQLERSKSGSSCILTLKCAEIIEVDLQQWTADYIEHIGKEQRYSRWWNAVSFRATKALGHKPKQKKRHRKVSGAW